MIITEELIKEAEDKGACGEALRWLREKPRTREDLLNKPIFGLWAVGHGFKNYFTSEEIKECALKKPWVALKYATKYLDAETLKECALKNPWAALEYVTKYLDEETLKECALREPWVALKYAAQHLDKETLKECARKEPRGALRYAAQYLDKEDRNKKVISEAKVKKEIKEKLRKVGAYYFMPVSNGMGRHGIPDIICCYRGIFLGIETKAPGKEGNVTPMQAQNLKDIEKSGGIAIVASCWDHVWDGIKDISTRGS